MSCKRRRVGVQPSTLFLFGLTSFNHLSNPHPPSMPRRMAAMYSSGSECKRESSVALFLMIKYNSSVAGSNFGFSTILFFMISFLCGLEGGIACDATHGSFTRLLFALRHHATRSWTQTISKIALALHISPEAIWSIFEIVCYFAFLVSQLLNHAWCSLPCDLPFAVQVP